MTTRPHLHVVNAETGEIVQESEQDILIDRLTKTLHGKEIRIGQLEREMRELQAIEPEHEVIRDILDYWREHCKPRATFAPASERWKKVRARLREKLDGRGPLTPDELKLAVDGALTDRWHTQSGMAHRLDADWLFRSYESVEKLRDLALGFKAEAGVSLRDILDLTDELRVVHWRHLLTVCECCGHRRLEHAKADPNFHGWERCFECECMDFYRPPGPLAESPHLQRWAS